MESIYSHHGGGRAVFYRILLLLQGRHRVIAHFSGSRRRIDDRIFHSHADRPSELYIEGRAISARRIPLGEDEAHRRGIGHISVGEAVGQILAPSLIQGGKLHLHALAAFTMVVNGLRERVS